jgi:hypothetical protein
MLRAYSGCSYILMLAGLFVIKHQALAYLPASHGYIAWHQLCAVGMGFNLLARFLSAKVAFRYAMVPSHDPGRFLLWPSHWRTKYLRYYVEPALLLCFILAYGVAGPPYAVRFVPMFWWDALPLRYGIVQPYPAWYLQHGVQIAFWMPFLTLPALWLHNRLEWADSDEGQREAEARRNQTVTSEQSPVFTPVTLR